MEELIKNDIEALIYAICQYENGQAADVDAPLIESIASKYGLEFIEIESLTKTTLGIQTKK